MTTQTATRSRTAKHLSHHLATPTAGRRIPAHIRRASAKRTRRLPLPLLALCFLMPVTALFCWLFLALTLRDRG